MSDLQRAISQALIKRKRDFRGLAAGFGLAELKIQLKLRLHHQTFTHDGFGL